MPSSPWGSPRLSGGDGNLPVAMAKPPGTGDAGATRKMRSLANPVASLVASSRRNARKGVGYCYITIA